MCLSVPSFTRLSKLLLAYWRLPFVSFNISRRIFRNISPSTCLLQADQLLINVPLFAASQGTTHDGESGRRVGHSGAFLGKARPLSGEGPQPREHTATRSRQQARQLPAHSRQVPQPTVRADLASVVSLREHVVPNHALMRLSRSHTCRAYNCSHAWRTCDRTILIRRYISIGE